MALPMMAPAATPPRMPAPTAQPTQSAFAGAGAIIAAMAMPAAPPSAMSDLCMCFPPRDARVPIRGVSLHPKGLLNRLVGDARASCNAIRRASSRVPSPNGSLKLSAKNKSQQSTVGAALRPSPHQEGAAVHDDDHHLGRPLGPPFFLVENLVTSTLTNGERFRLFFES
jgi:hypothetical protein